jgi:hypothetical protein
MCIGIAEGGSANRVDNQDFLHCVVHAAQALATAPRQNHQHYLALSDLRLGLNQPLRELGGSYCLCLSALRTVHCPSGTLLDSPAAQQ